MTKTYELRRLILSEILDRWTDKKGRWSWNKDGSVDVEGYVLVESESKMSKLPVKFRNVAEFFCCEGLGLETLEGCPDNVGSWFSCADNNLTSLDYLSIIHEEGSINVARNKKSFTKEEVLKIRPNCPVVYTDDNYQDWF